MKPYPISNLEGECARVFEEKISKPPTTAQKELLRKQLLFLVNEKTRISSSNFSRAIFE